MPFMLINLAELSAANGFTLWHYRTSDTRAAVQADGYFAKAADRLRIGDVILVQASDATAMLPIRSGTLTGSATILDANGAPPDILRSAQLPFSVTLSATAEARAIILDAMPTNLMQGNSIPVSATIIGPISAVSFLLRSAAGVTLATQSANVVNGRVAVTFAAQPPAGGYRILARNSADVSLYVLSEPFAIGAPPRLLREDDLPLLLEDGGQLLLF